jgi:hypothetical protein
LVGCPGVGWLFLTGTPHGDHSDHGGFKVLAQRRTLRPNLGTKVLPPTVPLAYTTLHQKLLVPARCCDHHTASKLWTVGWLVVLLHRLPWLVGWLVVFDRYTTACTKDSRCRHDHGIIVPQYTAAWRTVSTFIRGCPHQRLWNSHNRSSDS